MLETVHLTKVYHPKRGQPVKALDDVSLRFPEKGMVFILGRSGSGKSTLLNLLGGLDRANGGEVRIRGFSTSSFKQHQYDSYRNTYIGFVFQEYNLLDDFTVGANVALAMQLQGKKATDQSVGDILQRVDMQEFASRKPGELSGGQKQRVAIARALIKDPDIIMADEPTGALDSVTGKQVLDTLKKLSAEKLVILVSHDREFALRYADRIIELEDGRVVSDLEYENEQTEGLCWGEGVVEIPAAYHLTEEDRRQINEYIDSMQKGVRLQLGRIHRVGRPVGKIAKNTVTGPLRLLRSKLPLRHAFRMGAGALKCKRFRLVITVLLSCIAFVLFGMADTLGSYNHIQTCTDSLIDSGVDYTSVTKSLRLGTGEETYYREGFGLTEMELQSIALETGVELQGVYIPAGDELNFSQQYDNDAPFTETEFHIYAPYFNGYCEIDEQLLQKLGYTLTAGRLPDGTREEIAISEYVAHTFMIGGYRRTEQQSTYIPINSPKEMVGTRLTLDGTEYTVVGVVDTKMDIARYKKLTEPIEDSSTAQELLHYALERELSYLRHYALHESAMVGTGRVSEMIRQAPPLYEMTLGHLGLYNDENSLSFDRVGMLDAIDTNAIQWLDHSRTVLAKGEIVVSSDSLAGREVKDMGTLQGSRSEYYSDGFEEFADIRIVGVIDVEKYPAFRSTILCHPDLTRGVAYAGDGPYRFAVGNMPQGREEIKGLVSFCYDESGEVRYPLMNAVTYQLDTVHEGMRLVAEVFFYIGLGFALFAAMLLANFISVSIGYKKREIGILRAIGSRSNDVFRIFFSESFIIAMINFILSVLGVLAGTLAVNYILLLNSGLYLSVLHFGVRQVLLLFILCCGVAAIASYLPVRRIAAKRPIDAIRER